MIQKIKTEVVADQVADGANNSSCSPANEQQTTSPTKKMWDWLWSRSADATPLGNDACLEIYNRGFADGGLIRLVSRRRQGEHPVAGIALQPTRRWKLFREFRVPNNPWFQGGSLLTNKHKVTTKSFKDLATQIKALPCSFVTIDWAYDTIELQRLIDGLNLVGCHSIREQHFEIGLVNITNDWEAYFAERSKSFRKKIRRSLKKLQRQGDVKLERHRDLKDVGQLNELLEDAFRIEHLSWKGQSQTSVNSYGKERELYIEAMHQLASDGLLELQFLTVNGQRIAFEIGMLARNESNKKTWYSHKIGYDPQFAQFSPGQLLMYFQLREWFETREVSVVDTVGDLSEASAKWCNEITTQYRYIIATRFTSWQLLKSYQWLKPMAKRLLGRS